MACQFTIEQLFAMADENRRLAERARRQGDMRRAQELTALADRADLMSEAQMARILSAGYTPAALHR